MWSLGLAIHNVDVSMYNHDVSVSDLFVHGGGHGGWRLRVHVRACVCDFERKRWAQISGNNILH